MLIKLSEMYSSDATRLDKETYLELTVFFFLSMNIPAHANFQTLFFKDQKSKWCLKLAFGRTCKYLLRRFVARFKNGKSDSGEDLFSAQNLGISTSQEIGIWLWYFYSFFFFFSGVFRMLMNILIVIKHKKKKKKEMPPAMRELYFFFLPSCSEKIMHKERGEWERREQLFQVPLWEV